MIDILYKEDLTKEQVSRIRKIVEVLKQRMVSKFQKIVVNRLEIEWSQVILEVVELGETFSDEALLKQKKSQLGDFSLKNSLLRAIRKRKQLGKILLEREIELMELKRLGRGEGRVDLIGEVFSEATEKFLEIPYSHLNLLRYLLLRSNLDLTIAKKQEQKSSQFELIVELDEKRAYRAFFDYFWLKFKLDGSDNFKELKLNLDFSNSNRKKNNDFVSCKIENLREQKGTMDARTLDELSNFEERFFDNVIVFFADFNQNLFEREIKNEINLCKIRFTEIFKLLWKQFLKKSPLHLHLQEIKKKNKKR